MNVNPNDTFICLMGSFRLNAFSDALILQLLVISRPRSSTLPRVGELLKVKVKSTTHDSLVIISYTGMLSLRLIVTYRFRQLTVI